jgi:predicted dinucleotide-binding enzyme
MADVLKETLKIAFIPGTGNMGKSLARNHAKAGWHVLVGSRSKDKYDLLFTDNTNFYLYKINDKICLLNALEFLIDFLIFLFSSRAQLAVDELIDEHPELKIEAGTNSEVAAKADVVFWAPQGSFEDRYSLLKSLQKELTNKIIVDVTNVRNTYQLANLLTSNPI